MRKTEKAYEEYLNCSGTDYSKLYEYLYSREKQSGREKATVKHILKAGDLGTALRRYDPIAFECGFEDWNP